MTCICINRVHSNFIAIQSTAHTAVVQVGILLLLLRK